MAAENTLTRRPRPSQSAEEEIRPKKISTMQKGTRIRASGRKPGKARMLPLKPVTGEAD